MKYRASLISIYIYIIYYCLIDNMLQYVPMSLNTNYFSNNMSAVKSKYTIFFCIHTYCLENHVALCFKGI